LLDGLLPIDELKEVLSLPPLPEEDLGNYHTLGGFMFSQIGHIPKKTESSSGAVGASKWWTWNETVSTKYW
jgi:CBS domain containing-hemolysin-like protein